MVSAYEGTIDWEEGDDESVAALEIGNVMSGKYGEFLPFASLAARSDVGELQSQIFVSLFEGVPTILFLYTHPQYTRTGLAEKLIRASAASLLQRGFEHIQLFVTEGNPAVSLYRRIGFGG